MALHLDLNGKRALIDKANQNILIIMGVASFVVVFSLMSCKALFSQSGYQSRVIDKKEKALKQLKTNNKNVVSLVESYTAFATSPTNVLGGNPTGNGALDGDNPKIVLDALPSKYDFPGMVSGMTKMLTEGGFKIQSLGGVDDEVNQLNSASGNPAPVEIPFPMNVYTSIDGGEKLFQDLERSIRPIYVDQISAKVTPTELNLSVNARTFYLPEKTLKIGKEVVK